MKFATLLLILASVYICHAQEPLPKELKQRLSDFEKLHPSVNHCVLFRGLPRKPSQKDFTGPLFKQSDFLFYQAPIKVSDSDSTKILKLIFNPDDHQKNEPKLCGGFHPDYTIYWKTTTGYFKIMVCLSCHEWKLSDGLTQIYSDPTEECFKTLQSIVTLYLSPLSK